MPKCLMLDVDGTNVPVAGRDLDLRSKVHMLLSNPFQQAVLAHQDELNRMPTYRLRTQQLGKLAVIFLSIYIAGFIAVSWFLAGL